MSNSLQPIICPSCDGLGRTTASSGALACLDCQGSGMWLENQAGQRFFFPLPAFSEVKSLPPFPYQKWLRYGLAGISGSTLLLTGASILSKNGLSISAFLWQADIANALFGLSGFGTIYSLTTLQSRRASTRSLLDLNLTMPAGPSIDLSPYAHSRVISLLESLPRIASELHQTEITDTVFFIALLRQERIRLLISRLEITTGQLEEKARAYLGAATEEPIRSVNFSLATHRLFYQGILESLNHQLPYIDVEDFLLAYAEEGIFKELLGQFSIGSKEIYAVSRWLASEETTRQRANMLVKQGRARPKGFMNRAWTALPTPILDSYSLDITRQASLGNTQITTIREPEIKRVLQVLGQTQKNNVLLLGEPGSGKESILEAIALRMVEEEVPEILKDKRLVKLDTTSLLSNPNQAAQAVQAILDETAGAGNVILCIPDIHILVGNSNESLDAATLLSGALNKGWIQVVTTATYGDYHKYVESNQILTSLLETIEIKEATPEQTLQVLEEEVGQIRYRQKVWVTYPALETAANLAKKYLPEKILPASAIDLLDETASSVRLAGRQLVMKQDIEEVLEKKTGVPVKAASEQEANLLLNLEDELHTRIVGQDEAVHAVAGALRRARAGLHDSHRPISTFLFVGPTGVGKTETAKALASLYFGKEDAMLRFDMSEYQGSQAIYKLIGAPASDSQSLTEGGALTQPIREHPFSLILLDELEKADPEVLNVFLQIFDDGRVTENTGRTVSFNNTIIIATSNAGTAEILQLLQQGLPLDEVPKQILRILQNHFKPEFLNRFDAIVPFHPLSNQEIRQIVSLMLSEVLVKLGQKGYQISFTPAAIQKLANQGFDPLYGARPLRRLIQEKVEGRLAEMILEKTLIPGQLLQIDTDMLD